MVPAPPPRKLSPQSSPVVVRVLPRRAFSCAFSPNSPPVGGQDGGVGIPRNELAVLPHVSWERQREGCTVRFLADESNLTTQVSFAQELDAVSADTSS